MQQSKNQVGNMSQTQSQQQQQQPQQPVMVIMQQGLLPLPPDAVLVRTSGHVTGVYTDKWKSREPMNGEWRSKMSECCECPDLCVATLFPCIYSLNVVSSMST